MSYLPIVLGIAGVAALVFGAIGMIKYNQLMTANSTPTTEKNIIWWGSVIMILFGIAVMVMAAVFYWMMTGHTAYPALMGGESYPSQVSSPKQLSSVARTSSTMGPQRVTVATSPM